MVFQWFKNKNKTKSASSCSQQRLLILPALQTGHQIDFIYKVESQDVQYTVDLSLLLQPDEVIENVSYENKDSSLSLRDFIYQKANFSVIVKGGWDSCKSSLLFKVETNTKRTYQFTVLVTIISNLKSKVDLENQQRKCRLWALDRNPDIKDAQPDSESWIEGDMFLNIQNRYLWEYRQVEKQRVWVPLFVMNGAVEPVDTIYSDAQNSGERVILNQICSDQGMIKSNGKGNLSVKANITTDAVYTKAIVAGHPLGEGMLFTSQGMLAGHSLYVGSPEAKPKNIYIGMPGVVSSKLISTDYLQIAPLSIKEMPTQVTKGTLILCYDYAGYEDLVLLYARKDHPQSVSDWKPLFSSTAIEAKSAPPIPPRSTSKPNLYSVSFNPNIHTEKSSAAGNIIEMKSVPAASHTDDAAVVTPPKEGKHLGIDTYTRLQFEREQVPVTADKKTRWKNLEIKEVKQQITGEGQQYWSGVENYWKAPADGLLHIQGYVIFAEEQMKPSEPISYHAGDIFLLNIACNQEQKKEIYPLTQLEFPLVPYMNDVTHQICAHQQLPFTISYPVKKDDKITIALAYMHQQTAYGKAKDLLIKKAVITFFMS